MSLLIGYCGALQRASVDAVLPRIGAQTAGDSGVLMIGFFDIWNEVRKIS
jgi:hypothetical protein